MKKNSLTYIDQESVRADFKDHLDNGLNSRILFSARFGTGKSTFLNDFFEKSGDNYIALKLYPVNYSISHNKDVFELIKYDLIYELLSKHPQKVNLQKSEYSTALVAQMFLIQGLKIDPLLKSILKASAPESEVYTDIVNQLSGIVKQYANYKEGAEKNELDILNKYINQLKNYKGTAHEYDEISEVITSMLGNVKQSLMDDNDDKSIKTVLIIDDLDRLDPEHVFRLFNIFSAHYDSVTEENKFSFDKVIFVCDYNNIRLMYEHRYGKGVDFSGYIDKFYSVDVFNYNNGKYIKNKLRDIFITKPISIPEKLESIYGPILPNLFYNSFEYVLSSLYDIGAITLRGLEQFSIYDLPKHNFNAGRHNQKYSSGRYPFLILIHLLKKLIRIDQLIDTFKILGNAFEGSEIILSGSNSPKTIEKYFLNISLPFIISQNEIFTDYPVPESENTGLIVINNNKIGYILHYSYDFDMRIPSFQSATTHNSDIIDRPNIYDFLLEAILNTEKLSVVVQ